MPSEYTATRQQPPRRWTLDLPKHLTTQPKGMERLVDADTDAILFRHPSLRGIPDLVVEGDGYTLEFIGPKLLCVDINDPIGMVWLLSDAVKEQLPVGVQLVWPIW
jgi:hypothetical protein